MISNIRGSMGLIVAWSLKSILMIFSWVASTLHPVVILIESFRLHVCPGIRVSVFMSLWWGAVFGRLIECPGLFSLVRATTWLADTTEQTHDLSIMPFCFVFCSRIVSLRIYFCAWFKSSHWDDPFSSLKQDQNDMPRSVCHVGLGSRSKKDCFEVPEDGKNSKRTEWTLEQVLLLEKVFKQQLEIPAREGKWSCRCAIADVRCLANRFFSVYYIILIWYDLVWSCVIWLFISSHSACPALSAPRLSITESKLKSHKTRISTTLSPEVS